MDVDYWLKAVDLARKLYVLLNALARDAGWSVKSSKSLDLDRFYSVYFEDIHKGLKDIATNYYNNFDIMRKELEGVRSIDAAPSVAERLKTRIDESWFLRNTVRESAKAWLEHLPKASLERAYVWSVCNFFYRETRPDASIEELISDADLVADSRKDTVLDTPYTRLDEQLKNGELQNKEELKSAIDEEIKSMAGCLTLSERVFQELKVKNNDGK